MNRTGLFFVMGCCAALALMGCSNSSAPAAASTSGTPATAAAVPASGGCEGGAYRDEKLKFCIKLPPGFVAGPTEEKEMIGPRVPFENKETKQFVVVKVEKFVNAQKAKEVMETMAKPDDPSEKKEAGSAGDTSWVITTFSSGVQQFDMYTPGVGGMLSCYFQADSDKAAPLIEACKSLRKL